MNKRSMKYVAKIKDIVKKYKSRFAGKTFEKKDDPNGIKGVNSDFEQIKEIHARITHDELGGSPLNKVFIMSYLIKRLKILSYVEIGVYRGKSFFPLSLTIANNGGKSYGIDPYENKYAFEEDIKDERNKENINKIIAAHDFNKTYKDLIKFRNGLKWKKNIEIIKERSAVAIGDLQDLKIGMLHIDGNHDTKHVSEDYRNYEKLVSEGGLIVFDDIDWPSVRSVYEEAKTIHFCIFETENFGILQKSNKNKRVQQDGKYLSQKLEHIYARISLTEPTLPKVVVGMLSYNSEKYILESLRSIVKQRGKFKLKIILCDDCSQDKTIDVIERFIKKELTDQVEMAVVLNDRNMGVFGNFWKLLNLCKGYDFIGFCEADDRWASENHIQTHINQLLNNPECAVSANQITYVNHIGEVLGEYEPRISGDIFQMKDLLKVYFIGNLAACFHRGTNVESLDIKLQSLEMGDWFFNTICSQYGDIVYNYNLTTHYRKHAESFWGALPNIEKNRETVRLINGYNEYFNFDFDVEFSAYAQGCLIQEDTKFVEDSDLIIIDDVFPHHRSGFRYAEFVYYLESIKKIKILCNGFSAHVLGSDSIEDLIVRFKREKPQFSSKIEKFTHWNSRNAKLAYLVFLGNAYSYVELLESKVIPFVFELYPGGSFAINNPKSNEMLERVFESPMFCGVIVTQKITYDYIIGKRFCSAEKIKYIFGVVAPEVPTEYPDKKVHYGFGKKELDICFVAHRYSPDGSDKGYDIFIETAKRISSLHGNVRFHVVGNYDKDTIKTECLNNNLFFYGLRDIGWFEDFYLDKDILLSPNRPFVLGEGFFDGFPTGAATDAGLRCTAVFCTDELSLNNDTFTTGEDIEIINTDVNCIVEKIKYYYNNPDCLKKLALKTSEKMKEIYSTQSQMAERYKFISNFIR